MFDKSDEALHSLSQGEFEKAKAFYSVLLDKDAEDLDFISGYFVSSFWDNRLDLVLRTREGKERGNLLLKYFSLFEIESKKRNIHETLAYDTCLRCILEEASNHLKLAYQWEGANALDRESLSELAVCLIKIGDYKTALEILPYSEGKSSISLHLRFYLAEAYCMSGREKEGKETYRNAFFEDPQHFRYDQVHWPPMRLLVDQAKSSVKEDEIVEYIPVIAWRSKLFVTETNASLEEVKSWQRELFRLYDALKKGSGNQFKVKCRIEQYARAIIEMAPANQARDAILNAKNILEGI